MTSYVPPAHHIAGQQYMPSIDPVPSIVLAAVLVLIAIRQIGSFRLAIWQIMLGGAFAVLALGSIGPYRAVEAVDLDVMAFLFGMFVVGEALVESRYLHHLAHGIFKNAKSADALVLHILFVMGFFSAFIMNDTIAIIGTPLVLFYAKRHNIPHKLLLLSLCFATTLGSVASPIGNPQNLLIAIHGEIPNPFVTFFRHLALPTAINMAAAYILLKLFFKEGFHKVPIESAKEPVRDRRLADLCRISLLIILVMIAAKVGMVFTGIDWDFRLTYIAIAAAAPILLFSNRRFEILKDIDWHTLVFFAAMFVLMASVWQSGVIRYLMEGRGGALSHGPVLVLSVLLSQVLSNVPFVALYLPVMELAGSTGTELMALAAGSTIAGNLLILGAASNVIIIQNAEKRGGGTISFLDFAKVGVPLTIVNTAVYWVYFEFFI